MSEADAHEREGRRVTDAWRIEIEKRLEENTLLTATNSRQIHDVSEKLDKVNTAMFAETSDNEFKTPGVMTTMRKLDNHLDVMCTWAKYGRRAIVAFLAGVSFVSTLLLTLQQLGFFK